MLVLLVHLPNREVPDPTLGQPLGTRAEVMARIVELLPGTTFEGARGKFRRTSYELTFSIDGYQPRAVTVELDRDEGLAALKRIVEKTGWQVIDPGGPYFVDLGTEAPPATKTARSQYTATEAHAADPAATRHPRTPADTNAGRRGLLAAAAALVIILGGVLTWVYSAGFSRVFASREDPAIAEQRRAALTQTLDQVRACVDKYEASNPERGFPATLQQLGPNGEKCLGGGIAGGQDAGYRFAYLAGVPSAAGAIQLYSVCARPAKFPADGKDTLVASPRIGTKARTRDEQDATDSYSCVEAYDDAVAIIQHCALSYAAAHPQTGYPGTLADVQDCVRTSGALDIRTHSILKDGRRYTYIAAAADERGVVARFEIYGVPRAAYAGADRVFSDESGTVRIGRTQGLATPSDPLEQDDRRASSESQQRAEPGPDDLSIQCDAGVATACASLGEFYIDGKAVPPDLVKASPLLERACAMGDGDACHRFATLLRESSTQDGADYVGRRQRAAELDRRGCEFHNARSCFLLADLYLQGPAASRARAEGLFEDSCRMGVPDACRRLAGLRENDPRLLLKACAGGDFPECSNLNPPAGLQ